jgi:hypothetical protein
MAIGLAGLKDLEQSLAQALNGHVAEIVCLDRKGRSLFAPAARQAVPYFYEVPSGNVSDAWAMNLWPLSA